MAHIEAEPNRAYGPGELVRGDFRIRRLVLGGYTLSGSVAMHPTGFRCGTPNNMWINGRMPMGTAQEIADYWIGRFRWDSVYEADRARGRTHAVLKHPFGIAEPDGAGGAAVRLHYAVMINEADPGEPERMVSVATIERSIAVRIDEDRTIVVDQSAATRAMLEPSLRAALTVEYDTTQKAWVPLVKLRWVGRRPAAGDALLFGGMVDVTLVDNGSPADQGRVLLESKHDQSWWLVEPDRPDGRRSELTARPGKNQHFAGEVQPNWLLARASGPSGHRLMVRITPMRGNFTRTYGGLWADRVYDGVLVVPLDRWTLDEVRRYIVNGTVPDHAMP